jgi:hypothetical protein
MNWLTSDHVGAPTVHAQQQRKCRKQCFLRGPCQGVINGTSLEFSSSCGGGVNTSTVTLRVVGGDEKGSFKSETVKYGREYQEARTRKTLSWQVPAAHTKDRPVLSSERAPRLIGWLTVSRNMTLEFSSVVRRWPAARGVSAEAEEFPLLKPLPGNDWWKHSRLKILSVCCSNL